MRGQLRCNRHKLTKSTVNNQLAGDSPEHDFFPVVQKHTITGHVINSFTTSLKNRLQPISESVNIQPEHNRHLRTNPKLFKRSDALRLGWLK